MVFIFIIITIIIIITVIDNEVYLGGVVVMAGLLHCGRPKDLSGARLDQNLKVFLMTQQQFYLKHRHTDCESLPIASGKNENYLNTS